MDLLYISQSSAVRPTLHSQVHHSVTTSFSQYRWSSSVCLALQALLFLLTVGINFFNGWFRLHVRNYLICLFNKVHDLTTAMDWFVVCFVHETLNIFLDIIYFQMHLCVSPCFLFRVHVLRPCGS